MIIKRPGWAAIYFTNMVVQTIVIAKNVETLKSLFFAVFLMLFTFLFFKEIDGKDSE